MIWHYIVGAPTEMWGLYKPEKPKGDEFVLFDSDLLGFIQRTEKGSWDCFAPQPIGNQPNKELAFELVQTFLKEEL